MFEVTSWSELLSLNLLVGIWAYAIAINAIALYLVLKEFVWWRLEAAYNRVKYPIRYDKELKAFHRYMKRYSHYGIYIGSSADCCKITGCVVYGHSEL